MEGEKTHNKHEDSESRYKVGKTASSPEMATTSRASETIDTLSRTCEVAKSSSMSAMKEMKQSPKPELKRMLKSSMLLRGHSYRLEVGYNRAFMTDKRVSSQMDDLFFSIRKRYGVDEVDFQLALRELSVLSTNSKSGQSFLITKSKKFFVKSMSVQESGELSKWVQEYCQHLENNASYIVPIFGWYSIGKRMFFVMSNGLYLEYSGVALKPDGIFDLKGNISKHRKAKPGESTFKDLDFVGYAKTVANRKDVYFSEVERASILGRLSKDSSFFMSKSLIDYSLLLGVYLLKEAATEEKVLNQLGCKTRCELPRSILLISNRDGMITRLYSMVLIDFLQSFGVKKTLELKFKKVFKPKAGISVNDPIFYQKRFLNFMQDTVFPPN